MIAVERNLHYCVIIVLSIDMISQLFSVNVIVLYLWRTLRTLSVLQGSAAAALHPLNWTKNNNLSII